MPEALPVRQPAAVSPAETPGMSGLLTLAVFVVVVAGLYLGRTVLIPITLAVLLSFVLAPLANLLRRVYLGRIGSVLVAVLLALGIITALGGLIGTQIAGLAQQAPAYAETVQNKIQVAQNMVLSRLSGLMRQIGQQSAAPPPPARPGAPKPVQVEIHQPDPTTLQMAERIIAPVVDPLSTTAIVLIVTVFILLQREDLRDRLIRLFGSSDLHRTTAAMNDAARRLSRYFLTQLGINTAFGIVITAGCALIGLPSPVLWGIVGALLRFVPYIGTPLAAVLPVTLAAAVSPGWAMVVWTAALFGVTELITGQAVEPMLYGHSTGLSPFAVVVAAFFWTWLWGPIGLILSTPLTLCLVVLGRHVERLEFLDVILGDRPALTPIESFYQRMLAGDPDEARDQAEHLLRDRPLSSYYDEVALKGLQLAAVDATRGVLTEAQSQRIKHAFDTLLEDLEEYEDKEPHDAAKAAAKPEDAAGPPRAEQDVPRHPPPGGSPEVLPAVWVHETPILCIAGRGLLDDAASAMLTQLLRKNGLNARAVRHEAVSRTAITTLDVSGVRLICLCYLELAGTPSHLRYLLRRLRQRAPDAKLMVGLWPQEQAILIDERLRAAFGADVYTSTLRETVEACLEAARADLPAAA